MNRYGLPVWLGLLAAPIVVLGAQSVNYALVQVACATGTHVLMDAVSAGAFAFSVLAAWLAYRQWRDSPLPVAPSYEPRPARPSFLALMAMLVAVLCALIQLAMWFPQWLLSPCR